ncbi:hypothetical protein SSX86_025055 [Deinandra increscens subsp. villosa]|uniref:Uncharacterized protein n=1 Tax=Deinandra increscens subsp. villosa TaxID=3103831 RepID=A0AAP0CCM4_9ASTR
MRLSKRNQANGESKEGKRWMIAGIALRAPLKSVSTKMKISNDEEEEDVNSGESGSTTPTSNRLRTAECPPPPRKLRPVNSCCNKGSRKFYTSPDIDSFFKAVLNTGRAN